MVGDDGADGGVLEGAGGHAAGVDEVGGGGVLADDGVGDGAQEDAAVEQGGGFGEVLGELDAADGGVDGVVVRPGDLFAVAAALALNAAGAGIWFPETLDSALHMLGLCAVPTGLLVSGAVLADHMKPGILRTGWGITVLGIVLRLGLLPVTILAAAVWLPFDAALKKVLVIQSAMPAAVFPLVLAKMHGGDMPVALRVVLGTLIVSLATIPLWIAWAMRWIE